MLIIDEFDFRCLSTLETHYVFGKFHSCISVPQRNGPLVHSSAGDQHFFLSRLRYLPHVSDAKVGVYSITIVPDFAKSPRTYFLFFQADHQSSVDCCCVDTDVLHFVDALYQLLPCKSFQLFSSR